MIVSKGAWILRDRFAADAERDIFLSRGAEGKAEKATNAKVGCLNCFISFCYNYVVNALSVILFVCHELMIITLELAPVLGQLVNQIDINECFASYSKLPAVQKMRDNSC